MTFPQSEWKGNTEIETFSSSWGRLWCKHGITVLKPVLNTEMETLNTEILKLNTEIKNSAPAEEGYGAPATRADEEYGAPGSWVLFIHLLLLVIAITCYCSWVLFHAHITFGYCFKKPAFIHLSLFQGSTKLLQRIPIRKCRSWWPPRQWRVRTPEDEKPKPIKICLKFVNEPFTGMAGVRETALRPVSGSALARQQGEKMPWKRKQIYVIFINTNISLQKFPPPQIFMK